MILVRARLYKGVGVGDEQPDVGQAVVVVDGKGLSISYFQGRIFAFLGEEMINVEIWRRCSAESFGFVNLPESAELTLDENAVAVPYRGEEGLASAVVKGMVLLTQRNAAAKKKGGPVAVGVGKEVEFLGVGQEFLPDGGRTGDVIVLVRSFCLHYYSTTVGFLHGETVWNLSTGSMKIKARTWFSLADGMSLLLKETPISLEDVGFLKHWLNTPASVVAIPDTPVGRVLVALLLQEKGFTEWKVQDATRNARSLWGR